MDRSSYAMDALGRRAQWSIPPGSGRAPAAAHSAPQGRSAISVSYPSPSATLASRKWSRGHIQRRSSRITATLQPSDTAPYFVRVLVLARSRRRGSDTPQRTLGAIRVCFPQSLNRERQSCEPGPEPALPSSRPLIAVVGDGGAKRRGGPARRQLSTGSPLLWTGCPKSVQIPAPVIHMRAGSGRGPLPAAAENAGPSALLGALDFSTGGNAEGAEDER